MDQVPGSPQGPQGAQGPPHCYRHPDRETGIRCARCDKPICPDCMVSASVGFQCPDCVRGGSGTGHGPAASRPRTITGGTIAADPRLVTKILIGINVAVFIAVHVWDRLLSDFVLIGAWPPAPYVPNQGVAAWRVVSPGDVDVHAPGGVAHRVQHAGSVVARRPAGGGARQGPLHRAVHGLGAGSTVRSPTRSRGRASSPSVRPGPSSDSWARPRCWYGASTTTCARSSACSR